MAAERNRLRPASRMHYPVGVRLFSFVVVSGPQRVRDRGRAPRHEQRGGARDAAAARRRASTLGSSPAASPKARPDPTPEAPLGSNWVWVRGYWHWDGVRYVWVRGRWEPARPSYVRAAEDAGGCRCRAEVDFRSPPRHVRSMTMSGRSAVVTGAARGIGRSIAELLSSRALACSSSISSLAKRWRAPSSAG